MKCHPTYISGSRDALNGGNLQIESDILSHLVDLDRYPIDALTSARGSEFLRSCQQQMATHGWCNFDHFIKSDALTVLVYEVEVLLPIAETLQVERTIYQGAVGAAPPRDNPRAQAYIHRARQLANDQIPKETLIRQLYSADILTDFIRQVQGKDRLYRYADAFQALNVVALNPGSRHAWHYDVNECTVTLLLRQPDAGGAFTFLPNSRSESGENTECVDRFLRGDLSEAKTFGRAAGTLTLFRGGNSLHGVTEIEGSTPRVSAILAYSETPEDVAGDDVNIRIYGDRVARILGQ